MISERGEAYVWIWLPGATTPVVAGKLQATNGMFVFHYGKSYLARADATQPAIPIHEPELPLRTGLLRPLAGLTIAGCIRDAAPDAWGRRVILNKLGGAARASADTADLHELTYLLESGSDRVGALDFQHSPIEYEPRVGENVLLEQLVNVTELIEAGEPLPPALHRVVFPGSGGARPKALVDAPGAKYIAKFPSSADTRNLVKAEFVAMRLAALAGLRVAPVRLVKAAGRDVLLVERFDRVSAASGWTRKIMVSALTLLELDELMARYASYETLAEIIRHRFAEPVETLQELFARLAFNILCGNTDDHARNHAAFWDGSELRLTPAYDICPQGRTGNEASQAMLIAGENRSSQLRTCLKAAHSFLLGSDEAKRIFAQLQDAIKTHWQQVCDEAELGQVERKFLWRRQFLNPWSVML